MMVKGAVLDAIVLAWIGQSPECFQFRVETIKWIQEQLKDPARAISNATLGAIMTFTQWTVSSEFICSFNIYKGMLTQQGHALSHLKYLP